MMMFFLFPVLFIAVMVQGLVILGFELPEIFGKKPPVRRVSSVMVPKEHLTLSQGPHGRVLATNHNAEFRHIAVGKPAYDCAEKGDFQFLQFSGGWIMGPKFFFETAPYRVECEGMPIKVRREGNGYRVYRKINKKRRGYINAPSRPDEVYLTIAPNEALREKLERIINENKGVYRPAS
ncbi:hypothetical protein WNZ15_22430 [Roseibium sp. AS2]|uniref:hypothetical protein n=1 Tax=Roseibium sp. AS2 TaxID=3135781 RepID=UPI00317D6855